jgi:hypothetical protein
MLRLWGYCQSQKQSEWDKTPNLSAICRSSLPTEKLLEIMVECHFVRVEQGRFIVHDWERSNRILRSAWDNGKRGGPHKSKQPTGSFKKVQNRIEVTGSLTAAGGEPTGRKETENCDPEARKKLGQLLSQTSAKMRAGDSITTLKLSE